MAEIESSIKLTNEGAPKGLHSAIERPRAGMAALPAAKWYDRAAR